MAAGRVLRSSISRGNCMARLLLCSMNIDTEAEAVARGVPDHLERGAATDMANANRKGLDKVIWSLDAFEDARETQSDVARAIGALGRRKAMKVEAVYVLSP